jgi:hypothetical protein
MRGDQDIRVTAVSYLASGNGVGHICVRIGRVALYLEDREALTAALDAWGRAAALADQAFGPLFNHQRAEAAARLRRDGGVAPN